MPPNNPHDIARAGNLHGSPDTASPQSEATRASSEEPKNSPLVIASEEIFQGRTQVTILHGQERYRLMVTRNGKLILQK